MKLSPKFIQRDCVEGDAVDLRQARSILKHRPDVVIFEMPQDKSGPDTVFNRYPPDKKPLQKVAAIIARLRIAAEDYPYAASDIAVWENIETLWSQGHDVLVYNIDTPDELRRRYFVDMQPDYPAVRRDWLFWAYLLLRDSHMTKNLRWILNNYRRRENPTVVVFLQANHWRHVKFLLEDPSKQEIWNYYFHSFPKLRPETIADEIKARSKVLYKYWKKNGIF